MKKICIPIFNRATYARIRTVINGFEKRRDEFELTIILSSSLLWEEYGRASDYIKSNHSDTKVIEIEIPKSSRDNLGMALDTANIITGLSRVFDQERFDACLVIADRYETIAAAFVANCFNVVVIHVQGGETTGNIDERIRHAVTKLSDYHMTSTELAGEYVIEMGEHRKRVFTIGCPSLDIAPIKIQRVNSNYFMLMYHPVTDNQEKALKELEIVLRACTEIAKKYLFTCYVYLPNPDPGRSQIAEVMNEWTRTYNTIFKQIVNESQESFMKRLSRANFIIGNSSAGIRESSFLGIPSINIGNRQGLRERSLNVIDLPDLVYEKLLQTIEKQIKTFRYPRMYLYGSGNAELKMFQALSRIEFTRKGSLTYPVYMKFRKQHMGDGRHAKWYRIKKGIQTEDPTGKRRRLSRQFGSSWARICRKAIGS